MLRFPPASSKANGPPLKSYKVGFHSPPSLRSLSISSGRHFPSTVGRPPDPVLRSRSGRRILVAILVWSPSRLHLRLLLTIDASDRRHFLRLSKVKSRSEVSWAALTVSVKTPSLLEARRAIGEAVAQRWWSHWEPMLGPKKWPSEGGSPTCKTNFYSP